MSHKDSDLNMDAKSEQKTVKGKNAPKKPKSSRNTEKRRERSKVAARCRRGKESEIFTDLSNCLPVTESSRSNLDKASVMRLTLCDLKLSQMMESINALREKEEGGVGSEHEFDSLLNTAVSGFVLVCSSDGDVIYVTEGISSCLGLSQYEVMGQSLLEFSHPCDQGDVKEMLLGCNKGTPPEVEPRSALFRMKSANCARGRNVHHRTSNYKVVSCSGRIFNGEVSCGPDASKRWFVGICEPLLHPSDVDIPLNKQTFLSKHTPDMKFDFVDDSVFEFLGYKAKDMQGKSLFDFYHACDGDGVSRSFKSLYTKGQTVTERSRFLAKGGGWIWVVTQATRISDNAGKPTSVVCIHFVTSEVEHPDEILSQVQLRSAADDEPIPVIAVKPATLIVEPVKKPLHESTNVIAPTEVTSQPLIVNPFTGPILSKPTPSTAKIFAPRTEDMDTGFLMPVNDTLIITKEEPEDLTHLAPIAGDECVPLTNVPLLDDLLQWLDAADMEYTVLEGYEEPFPLPLIAYGDTPLPSMTMTMCGVPDEVVVKNDVVLERNPQCDSPLLLRSTDATLMSPDPMLLSPFKTPTPEPSPSTCLSDMMGSDLFSSSLFEHCHTSGLEGGGGKTINSSDKCKDGGSETLMDTEDAFLSFPMVGDFQETLFSPADRYLEEAGPSPSPIQSLITEGGGDGGGLLMKPSDLRGGGVDDLFIREPYETTTMKAEVSVGKYMVNGSGCSNSDCENTRPPEQTQERPLPCKVAKSTYIDPSNQVWHHPGSVTPLQPPWKVAVPHSSPSQVGRGQQHQTHIPTIRHSSTTTGTQTDEAEQAARIRTNHQQQRQQRHLHFQQLLQNPMVLQAILNTTMTQGGGANLNRKRNFLGKLLNRSLSMNFGSDAQGRGVGNKGGFEKASLVELTNQDCEVNAPLESKPLLNGPELLTALDTDHGGV